jgi:multidrug efflux pump subunit AcrA (membrane-fusion protein)
MFVLVGVAAGRGAESIAVPRSAVQTIGMDTVVFVPVDESATSFRERSVTLGDSTGDFVIVSSGLSAGDRVVTQGSFALRAEAERTGVRPGR